MQIKQAAVYEVYDCLYKKLREQDLNLRPSGYEPDELPDCSIPRHFLILYTYVAKMSNSTKYLIFMFDICQ